MISLSTAADRRKVARKRPPLQLLLAILADMRAERLARDNEDAREVEAYLRAHGRGVRP